MNYSPFPHFYRNAELIIIDFSFKVKPLQLLAGSFNHPLPPPALHRN